MSLNGNLNYGSTGDRKRERISQLHKKLHLNHELVTKSPITLEDTGPKIEDTTPKIEQTAKIRRNTVRQYLGDPLPLPYLINNNEEKRHTTEPPRQQKGGSSHSKEYANDGADSLKRLKSSLDRLKRPESSRSSYSFRNLPKAPLKSNLVDQAVQTENNDDYFEIRTPSNVSRYNSLDVPKDFFPVDRLNANLSTEDLHQQEKLIRVRVLSLKTICSSPVLTLILLGLLYYMLFY